MRAGVALGSNLGERLANLRNARKEIAALNRSLPPLRCSAIYETEPVNCEKGAAKFFNAAIEFGYSGRPEELRRELAGI
ncbi:MAG: dihydropteroate synthase, partial [Verrucomicrobia bacterium]